MRNSTTDSTEHPDLRHTTRRQLPERRGRTPADLARAIFSDRREMEQRGTALSMVDALRDILRWERTRARA